MYCDQLEELRTFEEVGIKFWLVLDLKAVWSWFGQGGGADQYCHLCTAHCKEKHIFFENIVTREGDTFASLAKHYECYAADLYELTTDEGTQVL